MSDPSHSRLIPVFLAFVLLVSSGGCTVDPDARPAIVPSDTTQPTYPAEPQFRTEGDRTNHQLRQHGKEVRCRVGHPAPGAPVICVDSATLAPDPEPARVWDVEGEGGQPTTRPVVVHWFTTRTGNLTIEFAKAPNGESCIVQSRPICDGRGHCVATVKKLNPGETLRSCKYTIKLDGRVLDPDFGVIPCCW